MLLWLVLAGGLGAAWLVGWCLARIAALRDPEALGLDPGDRRD
jgi:hypothetical protein